MDALARVVTRRSGSLFQADFDHHLPAVRDLIAGRKLLVIGGAGSIGSATVRELLRLEPRELAVLDVNENGLAELVRDVRSADLVAAQTRLRILPADYAGPHARRFLDDGDPFDRVLNFAAVKHVRSERDVPSVLHMLDVNVIKAASFLDALDESAPLAAYFAVSTDKAANPVNLMGASKRAMEQLMFARAGTRPVSSARFANVAFSDGSLLAGWLERLVKRQPWAVPSATRRFFVSPREAGQLCLMASTVAPSGTLLVPALDPASELRDLQEVATDLLSFLGFQAKTYAEEDQARAGMDEDLTSHHYPLLVTRLDTAGEKSFEEFTAESDRFVPFEAESLLAVQPVTAGLSTVTATVSEVRGMFDPGIAVTKDDILRVLSSLVPELRHNDSERSLDDRM